MQHFTEQELKDKTINELFLHISQLQSENAAMKRNRFDTWSDILYRESEVFDFDNYLIETFGLEKKAEICTYMLSDYRLANKTGANFNSLRFNFHNKTFVIFLQKEYFTTFFHSDLFLYEAKKKLNLDIAQLRALRGMYQ